MTGASIGVVIPNWNGGEHFRRCLESLSRQTRQASEIVVVDNNSSDGSWESLAPLFPRAMLVRLDCNFGFGYAVNRGIEKLGTEWVFVLNNDVELTPDFLEGLARAVEENPRIDVAATKLLILDEPELLDGAGDAMLIGGGAYRLGHRQRDGAAWTEAREVFGACGGAALYRRSLFAELGNFDEDFFAYLEDMDLSLRAHWAGYRCFLLPKAVAAHKGSASLGGELSPPILRLITRNQLLVIAKNYPLPLLLRSAPRILWFQLLWLLAVIRRGAFRYWILGYVDGLLRLPAAIRKRGRLVRRLGWKEMLEELRQSEASIWQCHQGHGSPPNALLQYYFWLFPPGKSFER